MNQLAPLTPALSLPALIAKAEEPAQRRFLEFFAVTIRNPNTRRAYARAVVNFWRGALASLTIALVSAHVLHATNLS